MIKHEIGANVSHKSLGVGKVIGYVSTGRRHIVEFASGKRVGGLLLPDLTPVTPPAAQGNSTLDQFAIQ